MASQGDPRVLFVMNLVLSTVFAAAVLWGLEFIGAAEFTLTNLAIGVLGLVVLTHLVTR